MKNIKSFARIISIFISIISIFNGNLYSQNNTLRISNEVSCKIPYGWSKADNEVLEAMESMKRSNGINDSSLKYLLYPTEKIGIYGYPLISIGYQDLGINLLDHMTFEKYVEDFSKQLNTTVIPTIENNLDIYFDRMKLNSIYSDKAQKQVIFKIQTGVVNEGQIITYTAIRIVRTGLVRVSLSVQDELEEQATPAFNIVLKTLSSP